MKPKRFRIVHHAVDINGHRAFDSIVIAILLTLALWLAVLSVQVTNLLSDIRDSQKENARLLSLIASMEERPDSEFHEIYNLLDIAERGRWVK